MFERFTDRARKVMQLANQEARRLGHEVIATEHILLGLLKEGRNVGCAVLGNFGISLQSIRTDVEELRPTRHDISLPKRLPQTQSAKNVVQFAMEEARELHHSSIGPEHFLLGLLREQEGVAVELLQHRDVTLTDARERILSEISKIALVEKSVEAAVQTEPGVGSAVWTKALNQRRSMVRTADPTRILDASANRATEGLRVVEDYARFVLDDAHLTRLLKLTRHELGEACRELLGSDRYPARDTQQDVGTAISTDSETQRLDAWDVCLASCERIKQSLRSLEEYTKVPLPCREANLPQRRGEGLPPAQVSSKLESLRYRFYTLEKALVIAHDSQSRLDGVRLCVLIDGGDSADSFAALVEKLIAAGVGMIQLRDKQLDDRTLLARARQLKSLTTHLSPLTSLAIINDRADIAAAAGADGVHLGQDDLSVKDARAIVGPRQLIGVSTHSIEQARAAVLDGANYLGAGPTFPSSTKSFDEFPGLAYLCQVTSEITLPTFAIGGINTENLPQVLETGITHIAVSSAITGAEQPGEAASDLLRIVRSAATR